MPPPARVVSSAELTKSDGEDARHHPGPRPPSDSPGAHGDGAGGAEARGRVGRRGYRVTFTSADRACRDTCPRACTRARGRAIPRSTASGRRSSSASPLKSPTSSVPASTGRRPTATGAPSAVSGSPPGAAGRRRRPSGARRVTLAADFLAASSVRSGARPSLGQRCGRSRRALSVGRGRASRSSVDLAARRSVHSAMRFAMVSYIR